MGLSFVPPLLLAAAIVAGVPAPAAAKRVEVLVDAKRGTEVTAKGANARRVASGAKKRPTPSSTAKARRLDSGAKGRRLVNTAKERPSAKVVTERKGSNGSTGSRARSVQSAANPARGVKGQQLVHGGTGDAGNGSNSAHCPSDARQQLESSVTALGALASGMGICQMAQESARLHTALASYHRRCVPGRKGEARASEYDRAAAQAEETARARCTTVTLPPSPPSQIQSPQRPRPNGPFQQDRRGSPGVIAVR
jgi:hypothetical protein